MLHLILEKSTTNNCYRVVLLMDDDKQVEEFDSKTQAYDFIKAVAHNCDVVSCQDNLADDFYEFAKTLGITNYQPVTAIA